MDYYFDSLEFKYNPKGQITSVNVDLGGVDNSISIQGLFIKELERHNFLDENNKEIFLIITRAIIIKRENSKRVNGTRKPYNLGNNEEFPKLLVRRISELLKFNISVDSLVAYFNEAKIEDLNNFINHPTLIDFWDPVSTDLKEISDEYDDHYYGNDFYRFKCLG